MQLFFFSSRRRHTRWPRDWSSDVCSSDLRVEGVYRLQQQLRTAAGQPLQQLPGGLVPANGLGAGGDHLAGVQTLLETEDGHPGLALPGMTDRKSTRLNSSHVATSYAVSC